MLSQRMFEPPEGEGEPGLAPRLSSRQDEARFVEQMMYLLTAPQLSWPGWEDLLQRHQDQITMQRLMHHREIFEQQLCTEFEAMLYVSTASLAHPITHQWAEIYMWLFRRWNPQQAQDIDIEERELDQSQVEDLNRLRRWIYNQQLNRIKERRRGADQKELEEEQRRLEAQQPRMFDLPEEAT
jgi:hypothetical protein